MSDIQSIILTERAAERIATLAREQGKSPALRITVEGGGCSGFKYHFELGTAVAAGDAKVENGGASLLVDPISLPFLAGSKVDFVDELIGSTFRVENPNAKASCGCGTSFSI